MSLNFREIKKKEMFFYPRNVFLYFLILILLDLLSVFDKISAVVFARFC